jgi:2-haloacid dehalogenase
MPIRAFVFDAYGTLFDVHSAIGRHRAAVGPNADRLSEIWRAKQLEYAWTLTLMGRYEDFFVLTERALDFALAAFPAVDRKLKPALMAAYRELDAYPDAKTLLARLRSSRIKTAVLSNGDRAMLDAAVKAAGLAGLLNHMLSVDAIGIYKPRLEVYALATQALHCEATEIAFVSSNRWDVAGAANAGMRPIWVNRAGLPDEYLELPPATIVRSLNEVADLAL